MSSTNFICCASSISGLHCVRSIKHRLHSTRFRFNSTACRKHRSRPPHPVVTMATSPRQATAAASASTQPPAKDANASTVTASSLAKHQSLTVRQLHDWSKQLFDVILSSQFETQASKEIMTAFPKLDSSAVQQILHDTSAQYRHNMIDELAQTAQEHHLIQRLALIDAAQKAYPHYDQLADSDSVAPVHNPALADSASAQQSTLEQLQNQLAKLEKESSSLQTRVDTMRKQRNDNRAKINVLDQQTKDIQHAIQEADKQQI